MLREHDGGAERVPVVLRHGVPPPRRAPAPRDEEAGAALRAHFESRFGACAAVWHELESDGVRVDLHVIPPSCDRRCWVIHTRGMSDAPIAAPDAFHSRYLELMVCLPSGWPVGEILGGGAAGGGPSERDYWPVRWLRVLARLPHQYGTFLGPGHTVPNGDPPRPFAPNTRLCCMLLMPAPGDDGLGAVGVRASKEISILSLVPLYFDEMSLKLRDGHAFWRAMAGSGLTDVIEPRRASFATTRRSASRGRA